MPASLGLEKNVCRRVRFPLRFDCKRKDIQHSAESGDRRDRTPSMQRSPGEECTDQALRP